MICPAKRAVEDDARSRDAGHDFHRRRGCGLFVCRPRSSAPYPQTGLPRSPHRRYAASLLFTRSGRKPPPHFCEADSFGFRSRKRRISAPVSGPLVSIARRVARCVWARRISTPDSARFPHPQPNKKPTLAACVPTKNLGTHGTHDQKRPFLMMQPVSPGPAANPFNAPDWTRPQLLTAAAMASSTARASPGLSRTCRPRCPPLI